MNIFICKKIKSRMWYAILVDIKNSEINIDVHWTTVLYITARELNRANSINHQIALLCESL